MVRCPPASSSISATCATSFSMTASASSTHAATSGWTSSKKFLRGTPTFSPATLPSSAAQSLGPAEPASATSAPSRSAASRTVRVIGPTVSNDVESGTTPLQLSKPALGRCPTVPQSADGPVSYTHLRAHETVLDLVCRLLLEQK